MLDWYRQQLDSRWVQLQLIEAGVYLAAYNHIKRGGAPLERMQYVVLQCIDVAPTEVATYKKLANGHLCRSSRRLQEKALTTVSPATRQAIDAVRLNKDLQPSSLVLFIAKHVSMEQAVSVVKRQAIGLTKEEIEHVLQTKPFFMLP